MGLSVWQILIVGVVILLFFGGGGKITRLMGDFGQGLKAFKKGIADDETDSSIEGDTAKNKASDKKADGDKS